MVESPYGLRRCVLFFTARQKVCYLVYGEDDGCREEETQNIGEVGVDVSPESRPSEVYDR